MSPGLAFAMESMTTTDLGCWFCPYCGEPVRRGPRGVWLGRYKAPTMDGVAVTSRYGHACKPCAASGVRMRDRLTKAQRRAVWERDAWSCVECGSFRHLHVDHIIPVVRGGTNDPENLQTLCRSCNSEKGWR